LLLAGAAVAEADQMTIDRGQQIYETLCTTCHGPYGRGDGPLAQNLSVPPPDLTLSSTLERRSDAELAKLLRYGSGAKHTPMVVSQTLNDDSLLDVVAYLRTLYVPGKSVSVAAGRDIYGAICWTCHGAEGDGNGPSAKNIDVKPRDFTSPEFRIDGREEELHRIISQGAAKSFHGSQYMLEWGNKLSRQQIDDVLEYLKMF
jgi:cytochrome c oxidase cbb3-type subunit 2/cytochrome c oxidase cbb3-type subunit I/II